MKSIALYLFVFFIFAFAGEIVTWEKQYDGGFSDSGEKIIKLNDGNFLVGAKRQIENGNFYSWLIKIDPSGDSLWTENWGITAPYSDCNILDIDENLNSDIFLNRFQTIQGIGMIAYLEKYDSLGNDVWSLTMPQESPSYGVGISAMTTTPDSGCIISRWKQVSASGSYGYIEKFDKNGNVQIGKSLEITTNDSTMSYHNTLEDIIVLGDGNYLAVGQKSTSFSYNSSYITKLDSTFNILWENTYTEEDFSFKNIVSTLDGNFLVLENNNLIKIRPSGNEMWRTNISIHCAVNSLDSNYVVASNSNIYKLDRDGNILWTQNHGCNDLVATSDGGFMATGVKNENVWVYKMDEFGVYTSIDTEQSGIIDNYSLQQNYPNPFNNATIIPYKLHEYSDVEINIYNAKGEMVLEVSLGMQNRGTYNYQLNANELTAGVYYYSLLIDGKLVDNKKMLYLK
jgi:hypothetical protein